MISVLEVTLMVPSFPQDHKHLQGQRLVHLKSAYKILLKAHHYLEIHYFCENS